MILGRRNKLFYAENKVDVKCSAGMIMYMFYSIYGVIF